ncbi:NYN domain-containing protein [Propionivibrio soli]|uniref:NYN domain-containing protein n=1 Tax=Propionivibrio soli TaxID=2976531 RepID=UPI0021E75B6C|nr:NYN domain-containing protein [Propionivibrio soli]
MAAPQDTISMAVFCDFENVALGVRDANYEKFDIKPVLERLLLKGSIVLKKAYCDWDRYKNFKATMHEANFELIEIPHVRQSGKNSADIRMVVDALDLCYTKSHVNAFVIISGDSDFSPLVSKLRENAKYVIGVGVKQSTSDLLIANCDEFIFYDDLVREMHRAARRDSKASQPVTKRSPEEDKRRKEENEARKSQAVDLAVETFEALVVERGDSGKIWASMLKEAIKRRKPDFNEGYYGFRSFGNLLEEAQARGLLEIGRDEKSGAFVSRGAGQARAESSGQTPELVSVEAAAAETAPTEPQTAEPGLPAPEGESVSSNEPTMPAVPKRRGGRRAPRKESARAGKENGTAVPQSAKEIITAGEARASAVEPTVGEPRVETASVPVTSAVSAATIAMPSENDAPAPASDAPPSAATEKTPPKRAASRSRRPRKPKATTPETPA